MESLRRSLVWLVQVLLRRWFLLFALFSVYYYHVHLDNDMDCSCVSQTKDCWVYLLVPGLILFVVQLWVDLVFARGLRHLCGGVKGPSGLRVAPVLTKRLLEALFVGLLWIQSVLLDGDWYLCCGRGDFRCRNYMSSRYETGPSREELHNESQVIGLLLIFVVFLVAAILSWLPWGLWFSSLSCDWPEAVLEEAKLTVPQRMRMAAQNRLLTTLDQTGADWRKWEELEKEMLLSPGQVHTKPVQTTVLMSSLTSTEAGILQNPPSI